VLSMADEAADAVALASASSAVVNADAAAAV
jgi:hypothetical protein